MTRKTGAVRRNLSPPFLTRQAELRRLKARHDLTYKQIGELAGFHEVSVKQWACGGKPIRERILRRIRAALAAHEARGYESPSRPSP
jgi:transcriptional regulator with XRE-family HTH domain